METKSSGLENSEKMTLKKEYSYHVHVRGKICSPLHHNSKRYSVASLKWTTLYTSIPIVIGQTTIY